MKNKLVAQESNQKFYDAFNKKDLDLMTRIWLNDPKSQCIHPGWDTLNGFKPIIESWRRIFETGQDLEIKLSYVEAVVSENLAWIACQENLFSISTSGVQLSKVHATNIFKQIDDEWKMVLHHASPVRGLPTDEKVIES